MPSHHTSIGANSLEHKERYDIIVTDEEYVCMYVCMYVCIKLHITTQSGPVILVFYATRIDPPEGGSMILITKTSDQKCMYVFIKLHITTQSGPVILVILCHSH